MLKPRTTQKCGLNVYVDNQQTRTRPFDAEDIERNHLELCLPFLQRRLSSSNLLTSTTLLPRPKILVSRMKASCD
ncbi:hypothetical protein BT96DRAFT_1091391, partial [Gymnopus androsaceus JB14]